MTFFRVKRIRDRDYVYEIESYRDAEARPRSLTIRYIGPVSPESPPPAPNIGQLRGRKQATREPGNDGRGASPEERRSRKAAEREEGRVARTLRERLR